jgi:hypothetical protein
MTEVAIPILKKAVESECGGSATYRQPVPIMEVHGGETVWDGVVHVFDLNGSPTNATRAYAWPHKLDNNEPICVVLHSAPLVESPRDAVRATILRRAIAIKG